MTHAAGAGNAVFGPQSAGTRFAIGRPDMTPREIELVQTTWKGVLPIRDTFAEIFYGRLFSLDGGLQRTFGGDMKEQGRNFAAMMSIFVRNLEAPETVSVALRGLGRRHAAYGVRPRDYETLSVALF
jgi:methyl-accepting chemotaxis protein